MRRSVELAARSVTNPRTTPSPSGAVADDGAKGEFPHGRGCSEVSLDHDSLRARRAHQLVLPQDVVASPDGPTLSTRAGGEPVVHTRKLEVLVRQPGAANGPRTQVHAPAFESRLAFRRTGRVVVEHPLVHHEVDGDGPIVVVCVHRMEHVTRAIEFDPGDRGCVRGRSRQQSHSRGMVGVPPVGKPPGGDRRNAVQDRPWHRHPADRRVQRETRDRTQRSR